MKVGFALEPIKSLPLDIIILLMKGTLIEHFEFNWRIIPQIKLVLKNLRRTTTTFHLPIFNRDRFDFSSLNEDFEVQIEEVISFVNDTKNKLNIKYTLAHSPEDPNGKFELMFSRLAEINTPIVLENVVGQSDNYFMEFYFQAKDYLGKRLAGHALDISHRYVNDWKSWLDIPKELEKEIVYIHISDCTKTEDLHLPMGLGEMPYNDFFRYLKKIKYNGIIMQELKPNGNQHEEIMSSGLECIKPFSKIKAMRMKLRHAIIRRIVEKRKHEFEDIIDLTAEEIGFDFV
ncbi:MAG: sugar phosphate isomerase/epimerase [Candidatus Heimdallarchaeota archaeon]|nr:sugar phosphate isomerase/epimerase [Candidatus Heimdallarchaeota archaeon]